MPGPAEAESPAVRWCWNGQGSRAHWGWSSVPGESQWPAESERTGARLWRALPGLRLTVMLSTGVAGSDLAFSKGSSGHCVRKEGWGHQWGVTTAAQVRSTGFMRWEVQTKTEAAWPSQKLWHHCVIQVSHTHKFPNLKIHISPIFAISIITTRLQIAAKTHRAVSGSWQWITYMCLFCRNTLSCTFMICAHSCVCCIPIHM